MHRKIKGVDNWKACPFCGHKELEREPSTGDISCNVCAYTFYDTSEDNTWWNSRPIEDQLRDENKRLLSIVQFAIRWCDDFTFDYSVRVLQETIEKMLKQALSEVTK